MGNQEGLSVEKFREVLNNMMETEICQFLNDHPLLRACSKGNSNEWPQEGDLVWARARGKRSVFWPAFIAHMEASDTYVEGGDNIDDDAYRFVMFLEKKFQVLPIAWADIIPVRDVEIQEVAFATLNKLGPKKDKWNPTASYIMSLKFLRYFSGFLPGERQEHAVTLYRFYRSQRKRKTGTATPKQAVKFEKAVSGKTESASKAAEAQKTRQVGLRFSERIFRQITKANEESQQKEPPNHTTDLAGKVNYEVKSCKNRTDIATQVGGEEEESEQCLQDKITVIVNKLKRNSAAVTSDTTEASQSKKHRSSPTFIVSFPHTIRKRKLSCTSESSQEVEEISNVSLPSMLSVLETPSVSNQAQVPRNSKLHSCDDTGAALEPPSTPSCVPCSVPHRHHTLGQEREGSDFPPRKKPHPMFPVNTTTSYTNELSPPAMISSSTQSNCSPNDFDGEKKGSDTTFPGGNDMESEVHYSRLPEAPPIPEEELENTVATRASKEARSVGNKNQSRGSVPFAPIVNNSLPLQGVLPPVNLTDSLVPPTVDKSSEVGIRARTSPRKSTPQLFKNGGEIKKFAPSVAGAAPLLTKDKSEDGPRDVNEESEINSLPNPQTVKCPPSAASLPSLEEFIRQNLASETFVEDLQYYFSLEFKFSGSFDDSLFDVLDEEMIVPEPDNLEDPSSIADSDTSVPPASEFDKSSEVTD